MAIATLQKLASESSVEAVEAAGAHAREELGARGARVELQRAQQHRDPVRRVEELPVEEAEGRHREGRLCVFDYIAKIDFGE